MVITSLFAVEHPLPVQVITILFLKTENEKNTFCFPFGPSSACISSYFFKQHSPTVVLIFPPPLRFHTMHAHAHMYKHSAALGIGIHSEI